ncbi:Na+/H+ antiporter subunit E [uncultured Thiodictyon sp.]|uniref:Na+/H+ antiporter subunit E n=1 Tax=uncultured Thiodictyon sp. TaxID=1846217 RepID=UPI0025DB7511|nr:Na+/H+ antiporter subunit E [uncultured Thiodictyon sp.]
MTVRPGPGGSGFSRDATARGAGFFGCWLLLAGPGWSNPAAVPAVDVAVGLLAAAAATWASVHLLPPTPGRVRLGALGRLLLRFLWQSIVGGSDVARRAFAPRLSLQPGYLVYPVRTPPGPRRALFGALTSLVPGTLPVGSEPQAGAGCALVYHCLDLRQPVADGLAKDEALMIQGCGEDATDV